jgi:hypothetical protein
MSKKLTTEEFIQRAKQVHGDKYNYSKVEYINSKTDICIICKKHGEFYQKPNNHLNNQKCPNCNGGIKLNIEQFIQKAKEVHENEYDYSKIKYINARTKVCIICKKHGEFYQTPDNHIHFKGCPKCVGKNRTTEEFIQLSNKIHENEYNYSKTNYINDKIKICIICPEHGEFCQKPSKHLLGQGCPKCKMSNGEKYIAKWLQKHNIKFISQYKFETCKHIHHLLFDFNLPKYNTCIEYDGSQHFKNPTKRSN